MKVFLLVLVLLLAVPIGGHGFEIDDNPESRARTVLEAIKAELARIRLDADGSPLDFQPSGGSPFPPQLPRNFNWKGRYVVRDLNVDVSFTWTGKNGNSQMIAGSWLEAIYFTNIIYDNNLYTLTYKWPTPIPTPGECSKIGKFTLDELNLYLLLASHYVGAEILEEAAFRLVHHFRVSVVSQPFPNDLPILRIPVALGDFYVERGNPKKFWKVLHFGLQNLYDPSLDEWIVLDSFLDSPGVVSLPFQCWGK